MAIRSSERFHGAKGPKSRFGQSVTECLVFFLLRTDTVTLGNSHYSNCDITHKLLKPRLLCASIPAEVDLLPSEKVGSARLAWSMQLTVCCLRFSIAALE